MRLLEWIWNEAIYYGFWTWLCFATIAFVAARFGGLLGTLGGFVVIGITVIVLDIRWVFDEMKNHPEDGKDADMIFFFVTLIRAAVFNLMLSPISVLGWRLFRKRRQKAARKP